MLVKLFLCFYLQGVDTIHSLTDGKLLTVKLKETKKSLDSMWINFKSVLSESHRIFKDDDWWWLWFDVVSLQLFFYLNGSISKDFWPLSNVFQRFFKVVKRPHKHKWESCLQAIKTLYWWHARRQWCHMYVQWTKTSFQLNCELHNLTLVIIQEWGVFSHKETSWKTVCWFLWFTVEEKFYWHFLLTTCFYLATEKELCCPLAPSKKS